MTGTLAALSDGIGVIEDLVSDVLDHADELDSASPHVIPLAAGHVRLSGGARVMPRRVRVTGRWAGEALEADAILPPAAEASAGRTDAPLERPARGAQRIECHPESVSAVRLAEAPFWADGTLVARREEPFGRVVYAAHDAPLVRETLHPMLGDSMVVTSSRWGREVFAAIEEFLRVVETEALLIYVGQTLRPDGYRRNFVGLKLITPEIARLLDPVPEELLSVHLLLTPLGMARPPSNEDVGD